MGQVDEAPSIRPAMGAAVPEVGAIRSRLVSLDAFRGFTMAWIVGGKPMMIALLALAPWGLSEKLHTQLIHTPWEGLRFYDLIWPSFMLMVGVAIPFSRANRAREQTEGQRAWAALRRSAVLFLLGSLRESVHLNSPVWIELSSALQPIALAYLVASLLASRSMRTQAIVGACILAGCALLLAFVGAPGVPAGSYAKDANLVWYVDNAVLHRPEPEGWGTLLSGVPTISTTLLGLIVGEVLLSARAAQRKAAIIGALGVGGVVLGAALGLVVPVIMKLWTSSYGLESAGWACLMLLAFYWIVDVRGWRAWTFPFVVIGSNAIAIYIAVSILPIGKLVGIFTKPLTSGLGGWGTFLNAAAVMLVQWLVLLWMYRRRIFIKA